jgi:dTMP kinase
MLLRDVTDFVPKGQTGFLVLEGVNGAGKTTLQRKIGEYLAHRNIPAVLTREPGSASSLGSVLRTFVLDPRRPPIDPVTELLLYAADRSEHVASVIRPAMQRQELVVCDRYYYSSIAFQGYGRGVDVSMIESINQHATRGIEPDLVILLDLPPELGLARTVTRRDHDIMEHEDIFFHRRIRDGFRSIAAKSATPFLIVDATEDEAEVYAKVIPVVERLVASRRAA